MKKMVALLVFISMFFIFQGTVNAGIKFIDCPDCNNGHSPSCVCEGKGEYAQNCDQCNGAGELACSLCHGTGELICDLCNGLGTYDDNNCYRCGGDGSMTCNGCGGDGVMTCNRCGGSNQGLLPCRTPSCERCGGTGRYPEGSPEHLQQLRDEGKEIPVELTENESNDEKNNESNDENNNESNDENNDERNNESNNESDDERNNGSNDETEKASAQDLEIKSVDSIVEGSQITEDISDISSAEKVIAEEPELTEVSLEEDAAEKRDMHFWIGIILAGLLAVIGITLLIQAIIKET